MEKVRTRFAPSPTGYMHVGNLRTALYTFLTAKHYGGDFILRIEDTDQGRLVEGSVDVIFNTLVETGLRWDEGPDIGGPVGPYVQSKRMGMYKKFAEELVEKGMAYYCFCTEERLAKLREQQTASGADVLGYDRHCRNLSKEEVQEKLKQGLTYVIRQKMPLDKTVTFDDLVYGQISVESSTLEDQILIKSDGMPTYNFANVIDDHLMGITHVLRGNEYLSSSPKYNLLYEAFGWTPPIYVHCPPVMKDQHNKLSKRNGDASYQDLKNAGFLSGAILNYLLLLGWSPASEEEIFSLDEMIKIWDPARVKKSPAIFDMVKLKDINSKYISALTDEEFEDYAKIWMGKAKDEVKDFALLCKNLKSRCETLKDIETKSAFVLELPEIAKDLYFNKKQKTDATSAKVALQAIVDVLENFDNWQPQAIFEVCAKKATEMQVKNGWLLFPMGIALSGTQSSPGGGTDLAVILGKEKTISRLKQAINNL